MTAGPFEYRGAAAGLTEALIRTVILVFYEKVRRNPVLRADIRRGHWRRLDSPH